MTEQQYKRSESIYNNKEVEEHKRKLQQFIQLQLMQDIVMIHKHGQDIEMVGMPTRNVTPDIENRLHVLETENRKIKNELASLTKRMKVNIDALRLLTEHVDNVVTERLENTLEEIGFKPITSESLSKFENNDIEKVKSIIIKEIRITNGNTDPGVISLKFNLPFKLVAGCFDLLLSEGKIGETSE